ncbi:methionyl-tRNA formyltransferase [Candidatus Peregrinibacteria bacterium CG_4_10_14_0_2_um_filter_43_11]|nr:MAG: methionyl-tRNA formyltransferase [Candidatus Peregrinibacteria bacterium CG_4_10_14_0_2_um_filter_43_11]
MNPIRLIFAGTPEIAVPLLRSLAEDKRFELVLVVTQEDKPAGRRMELQPSAIKRTATELEFPLLQPKNINDFGSIDHLRKLNVDLMVVMAYGQIFSKELLYISRHGCINVHASLLPKYRGASPIQHALLDGEEKTGITIMHMEEQMDTGSAYDTFSISITSADDAMTLREKLGQLAGEKTPDVLLSIIRDNLKPEPQEGEATYCQKIQKTDGKIDWKEPALPLVNKIRAYAGWPGSFTFWNEKRLIITKARVADVSYDDSPGTVFERDEVILVTTGSGSVELSELQLEGGKTQSIDEFVRGYPDFIGVSLG